MGLEGSGHDHRACLRDRQLHPPRHHRRHRKRRRRWPAIVALSVGVVLVAAAVIWRSFAVPALVKFPTDVDQNPRYEGTFVLFVDPATAAPLDEPTTAGLAVNRHIEALPAESGAHDVVVRETITFEVEGLPRPPRSTST